MASEQPSASDASRDGSAAGPPNDDAELTEQCRAALDGYSRVRAWLAWTVRLAGVGLVGYAVYLTVWLLLGRSVTVPVPLSAWVLVPAAFVGGVLLAASTVFVSNDMGRFRRVAEMYDENRAYFEDRAETAAANGDYAAAVDALRGARTAVIDKRQFHVQSPVGGTAPAFDVPETFRDAVGSLSEQLGKDAYHASAIDVSEFAHDRHERVERGRAVDYGGRMLPLGLGLTGGILLLFGAVLGGGALTGDLYQSVGEMLGLDTSVGLEVALLFGVGSVLCVAALRLNPGATAADWEKLTFEMDRRLFAGAADAADAAGDSESAVEYWRSVRDVMTHFRSFFDLNPEVSPQFVAASGDDLVDATERVVQHLKGLADERAAQGDLEAATADYEAVLEELDELRSLHGKYDAEAGPSPGTIRGRKDEVRTELARLYCDRADAAVETAERSADDGEFDDAIAGYERALERLSTASDYAAEAGRDGPDVEGRTDEVREALATARLSRASARLDGLEARIDADPADAAAELDEFVAALRELDLYGDRTKDRQVVERRALDAYARARTAALDADFERAATRIEAGEYETAREAFETLHDEYETTAARLADADHDFAETVGSLERRADACETNAERAREAAFGAIADPDVVPLDGGDEDATAGGDDATGGAVGAASGNWSRPPAADDGATGEDDAIADEMRATLPDHEVVEYVGGGGNADVHAVRLADSGRVVALKVPRWEGTASASVIDAFLSEAETWAKLDDHENIVDVLDWGSEPYPWLLLEYLPKTLGTAASDVPTTLGTLAAVADAVEYAHGHGVVHLDLKPENVLVDDTGAPKVADWGLSRVLLDQSGSNAGLTPPYSAPEQLDDGGTVDRRTDVYQLGVVAYELLTGRLPFEHDKLVELRRSILDREPDPPSEVADVPPAVDRPVMTALAKNPADRYDAMVLFRDALADVRNEVTDEQ